MNLFVERNSFSLTNKWWGHSDLIKVKLSSPIMDHFDQLHEQIIGVLIDKNQSQKSFYHPSGNTETITIVDTWYLVPTYNLREYRDSPDNEKRKTLIIEIPFDQIISVEAVKLTY